MPDPTTARPCLNCGHGVSTERFCPVCGQSTRQKRITFRETISDFLGSMFSLEGAYPNTLAALFTHPGELFRDYLAGKRKSYYKPVPFFVVNTAIYLLVTTSIGYDPLEGTNIALSYKGEVTAVALTAQAARFMTAHINHILIFLVISLGGLAKLYFWKRYNLAEYVAVAFYVAAGYIAFGVLTALLSHYAFPQAKQIAILGLMGYVFFVYPAFLQDKRFTIRLRALLLAVTGFIAYALMGFGFSFLVVWLRS